MSISAKYKEIRAQTPAHVTIVVAAKTRTTKEIAELIEAGASDIGENYVQEAITVHHALGEKANRVKWHMIGYLQKNKINKALPIFDVIQTVDSYQKAEAIDQRVEAAGKNIIPVYLEINIGNEDSKAGIKPEEHEPFETYMERLIRDMTELNHLNIQGLMTMGPRFGNPEASRPYFRRIRQLFEKIKDLHIPRVDMKHLSMGMTNSYKVAISEGATMVRIGTAIFGKRDYETTKN